MVEKFVEYLKYEKNFSQHTITSYRNDIRQFGTYLKHTYELEKPEEASSSMIRSWMASLIQDEKMTQRSVVRKASSLRTFYRYLLREGIITTTPMAKVNAPKAPSRLPVFVNKKDIDTLFRSIKFPDTFIGHRDRLILEMFYATGIRLSELLTLKDADVNIYNLTIKVFGKRSKERIIPITPLLKGYIESWGSEKTKIGIKGEYFFTNEKGKKLYEKQVYLIVHNYLGMVTTLEKKSPHVLRHSFATHILDNGADINTVKELLGHANLAATQVYTHNTLEKLKRVYKQSHPRG
jgi:integrase/recombinase XerC